MSVIFIFIDGVGIGKRGIENPFYTNRYESFEWLSGGSFTELSNPFINDNHLYKAIDANLGVEGLPQSGTGQTSLFTGCNASQKIGKHFGPFPHSQIKPLLKEQSIFHAVQKIGKRPYFMNAYPPVFFEISKKRNRWSCTTLMTQSAGIKLHSTNEVLQERALTAEIVQNAWREKLNINLPKISAKQAAQRLLNVLPETDLLLYEYYLTDKAGHNQSLEDAHQVLTTLNEFLLHILKYKRSNDLLLVTSDHGNLEDLSTRTHTRNPVPLFAVGRGANHFYSAEYLTDVKNGILEVLKEK